MTTKHIKASIQSIDDKVSFIASTSAEDRMGDVIDQKGWKLDNYKKNPVILFGHDHDKPIGRATNVYMKDGNLAIDVEFMPEEVDSFAAKIGRMVKAGFLNAVSVGFRPLEMKPLKSGGLEFLKNELLEVSVVSVPANQEALAFAKSFSSEQDISRMFVTENDAQKRIRAAVVRHKQNMLKHI